MFCAPASMRTKQQPTLTNDLVVVRKGVHLHRLVVGMRVQLCRLLQHPTLPTFHLHYVAHCHSIRDEHSRCVHHLWAGQQVKEQ